MGRDQVDCGARFSQRLNGWLILTKSGITCGRRSARRWLLRPSEIRDYRSITLHIKKIKINWHIIRTVLGAASPLELPNTPEAHQIGLTRNTYITFYAERWQQLPLQNCSLRRCHLLPFEPSLWPLGGHLSNKQANTLLIWLTRRYCNAW